MYSVPLNVPGSVRVAVREFLSMSFSNGMRNRHVATVNWLASDGPQHGIVAWMVFTNTGDHLGVDVAREYAIPCGLPGYEVRFHLQHGHLDTTHRLVMVPRCMNGARVGVDEPFLLLLHVNVANGKRPHVPISFANFSPAMPYWGLFHTIASDDEQRILRISTKCRNDRRIFVWQLMRQKHLPFQLLDSLAFAMKAWP